MGQKAYLMALLHRLLHPRCKGANAMKDLFLTRLYFLLLLAALAWVLLGAPLLPAEWQDVPHRLAIMARQLPGRMANLFALWVE